jgi:hypothetical protein
MSARSEPRRSSASPAADDAAAPAAARREEESIDALPVLSEPATLLGVRRMQDIAPRASQPLAIPVVQAAAAAAGGFVAGAAVVGFVHRRQRRAELQKGRRGARGLGRKRQPARAELVQIVGSRSLLLDVHLLGER